MKQQKHLQIYYRQGLYQSNSTDSTRSDDECFLNVELIQKHHLQFVYHIFLK